MESLGYTLIYFAREGKLPWQGLKNVSRHSPIRIQEVKFRTKVEDLCDKIPANTAFIKYLHYCRKLVFDEKPDYQYLRNLFRSVAKKYNYCYQTQFDWVLYVKVIVFVLHIHWYI